MRGKCMECKQPRHFQWNVPVRRQRLLRPDEDAEALPDVESSVVPQDGSSDGAGSSVSGHLNFPVGSSSVHPPVVSLDGAGSPAASQSILAAVSKSAVVLLSGRSADGASCHMDTRDNQLDEFNNQVLSCRSIGAATNSPDSLSGAVVLVMRLVLMRFSPMGQLARHQILRIHCLELLSEPQILFHVNSNSALRDK